ncbi:MaoC family dehydratase [Rhodococcus qingshengii]|uniref:MaoC family dehydratase n=1 Tax=Rhodococcus qingshengii TaxID=334542 RepID=UPI001BEBBC40|nr:MaoC family dehydratase [Rhodococcus qingshengii]MBT2275901.1 MaoC family dehydratase [Rhodococcus qingshengii]
MKKFNDISELESALGTVLGESAWQTITQEQIDQFAEATGDRQWIHVDPLRAQKGPFGTTIAHGYLTLSLVPVVLEQTVHVGGISMSINYGSNKVRFPSPAPVGSKLRGVTTLKSVEPTATGTMVVFSVTVERDGAAKPVCVAEVLTLLA